MVPERAAPAHRQKSSSTTEDPNCALKYIHSILVESESIVKVVDRASKRLPQVLANIRMTGGTIHDHPPPSADTSSGSDCPLAGRRGRLHSGSRRQQLQWPAF